MITYTEFVKTDYWTPPLEFLFQLFWSAKLWFFYTNNTIEKTLEALFV